ncbi:MAG: ATP-binding cassette domain-containing protein [Saprospiraceae bacterium]|nr:ATP-binding cassette domain-containing protein [Saprospiraceae bacterium]
MLEARDLKFTFKEGATKLDFPDIECSRGEQWLLLGQSGSGKTTLLHLLGGLRRLDSGTILIDGQDISTMRESRLDSFRGRNIGIIFQQSHFLRALTVKENLRLGQTLAGLPVDDDRIVAILKRLGIVDKADSRPHRLSVGEQQRASICRALVNRPKLILADEPTSALDDDHCEEVISLLREQAAAEQITLLIVTHDNRLKSVFEKSIELKPQLI